MRTHNWKMIGNFSEGRDNNLNLLRFLAALAVVASHTVKVVWGDVAVEPFEAETGYTLGHLAVNVFFIISGFLIAQSLVRSKDLSEYFAARFLRLIPGLFVASLVTVFIIGPLFSTEDPSTYFAQLATWLYVPLTSSMLLDNGQLPGVFATAPYASELNAPLWTLRWEALAYIGSAVLGTFGLMTTKQRFGAIFFVFVCLYGAVTAVTELRETIAAIDHLMRFGLCFLLGSAFYMFRSNIPLTLWIAIPICLLPAIVHDTAFYQMTLILALGYATFWLAYIPGGAIRKFNKLGDFSYGIYIYGFPIKQVVISLLPVLGPVALFAIASPIIVFAAALSYYLVEKPALGKRKELATTLRGIAPRLTPNKKAAAPAE